tara:strand:- start:531 stop:761 length:231 start_codon:yes stop_codon:yes gene_type:complete
MDKKKKLDEGLLDTAVKGIVGIYFGGKLLKGWAAKRAMKDPEVKKALKNVKDQISKFDSALEKAKAENEKLLNKYS